MGRTAREGIVNRHTVPGWRGETRLARFRGHPAPAGQNACSTWAPRSLANRSTAQHLDRDVLLQIASLTVSSISRSIPPESPVRMTARDTDAPIKQISHCLGHFHIRPLPKPTKYGHNAGPPRRGRNSQWGDRRPRSIHGSAGRLWSIFRNGILDAGDQPFRFGDSSDRSASSACKESPWRFVVDMRGDQRK